MKRIFSVIALMVALTGVIHAQTVLYAEGADLPNTGNGTTLTINSAGTYTVSGTLTTAADGQDRHELVIGSGLQLTNATYAIGSGGSPSGGQINWAGLANPTWSANSSGSIGLPGLPYGAGTYSQIMVAVNFSTGTTWTITYTVTAAGSAPTITGNPSSVSVCAGGNQNFSVTANNSPTSYVWQVSTGGPYSNISNGGVYSTATTATLNITGATIGMNGYLYRAIAVNGIGNSSPSTSGTLTVNGTVGATSFVSGATSTRCQGAGSVTYTATATNNTGITYTLDATSLGAGNSINSSTGQVTYVAGWSGTSTITASAAGCSGPTTANHTVTITPTVGTPIFASGSTSTRCQGAGSVTYTANATNTTGITYSLDATSLGAGNSINSSTGQVTYVAGWSGTSTITASAAGCNGPTTANPR